MSFDLDDKQIAAAGCALVFGALVFYGAIIGLIALALKWVLS